MSRFFLPGEIVTRNGAGSPMTVERWDVGDYGRDGCVFVRCIWFEKDDIGAQHLHREDIPAHDLLPWPLTASLSS